MSTPSGERTRLGQGSLEIRPYRPGDESGLLDVWNSAMWADPISAATWRSVYLADPNFRREHCPVAVEDDCVVGFVLAFSAADSGSPSTASERDAWVVGFGTLARHRHRGIATHLFDFLEREVLGYGIGRIVVGPYIPSYVAPGVDVEAYPEAVRFLEQWGAAVLNAPLSMKVSLTGYRPQLHGRGSIADEASSSIVVREATPLDIVPCIEFVRLEFPHWIADVTSVASRIFGGDSGLVSLFVAYDGAEFIGFAMSRGERFGPFGVRAQDRGRGIGSALLAATLMTMRAKGFHCAWFLWTNDRAARLYESHGFKEVRRFALMAKDIAP